ncbi:MAG TPA: hypothetical protein VMT22_13815 [Terriglobales bacterium]|jgi:hypothetical protein|nr:hypothetical protein [Terriglobales bacterium]
MLAVKRKFIPHLQNCIRRLPVEAWVFILSLGALVPGSLGGALAAEDDAYNRWYFTAEEVEAAYQYQQNYGERLRAPLRAGDCVFRNTEFSATYRGTKIAVPCRFVTEVTRHLKEMLNAGAAKFLFPLDADHAHLGVPREAWDKKYKDLPVGRLFAALVRDPELVALYHTAEHLRVTDRKTGQVNAAAKEWQDKRNVLGFFNGRPIKILSPQRNGQGASMPEEYYSYSGFTFLVSPRGELFLSLGPTMVTFDVAFDAEHSDETTISSIGDETRLARSHR